ncbi:TSN19 protein, partial [Atractosteus spatula]|nr:TSN19 protein [Atractosteus spatula]
MKVEDKIQILRFFLMVFNGVFLVLGFLLLGSGLWILFDRNSFITLIRAEDQPIEPVEFVATCLLIIGFVVAVVCFIGCLGAYKEIRCLLLMYMSCLIIIVSGQVLITLVLLINKNKINDVLEKEIHHMITTYGGNGTTEPDNSKNEWKILDAVQHNLECCGIYNFTDWWINGYIASLNDSSVYPCSCFNITTSRIFCSETEQNLHHYKKGCGKEIDDWLSENIFGILSIGLGLTIIQVLYENENIRMFIHLLGKKGMVLCFTV